MEIVFTALWVAWMLWTLPPYPRPKRSADLDLIERLEWDLGYEDRPYPGTYKVTNGKTYYLGYHGSWVRSTLRR